MERNPEVDAWLASARTGSPQALGQALEACRVYLTMVAEREMDPLLRSKEGASDLVQETFMEAQRAFPTQFRSDSKEEFLAWLRAMLLNNLADFRRRYRGTQKRSAEREVALDARSSSSDWRGMIATVATPSGEFVQQETLDQVQRAVDRLPEDYRRVVTYRYLEDRSFEEIAQLMNRTGNATRKLFARAIERLQAEMESPP